MTVTARISNAPGARPAFDALSAEVDRYSDWLFGAALPLWWDVGADRERGGFHEKITLAGAPTGGPRRTRVVGRQLYSFAVAAELGWSGPCDVAVGHGLVFLRARCMGPDGLLVSQVEPDGVVVRPDFDLYDQAFGLFGLAAAARVSSEGPALAAEAAAIRDRMIERYGHPAGGFYEGLPIEAPLLANPHMHVFEACLAWAEVVEAPGWQGARDGGWRRLADEIAELALARFIQPDGHLLEFYELDWSPQAGDAGRIVEPGHQFEWAWLLIRWGLHNDRADAIAAARRLIDVAETHGINPSLDIAINELWSDMSVKDGAARLWPQTERLKAHLAAARIARNETEREAHWQGAVRACSGLARFLETDVRGLWIDRYDAEGRGILQDAPTSSLYHIVCALRELILWGRK